jgi:hypothetical protein
MYLYIRIYMGAMYLCTLYVGKWVHGVVVCKRGDQIGLIFANRAILFLGSFSKNYRSSANFLATLFPQQKVVY